MDLPPETLSQTEQLVEKSSKVKIRAVTLDDPSERAD